MRLPVAAVCLLICFAAPTLSAQGASPPDGFRELTFDQFTRHHFLHDLPVRFRVPSDYVPVAFPHQVDHTLWMSPADSTAQAANPDAQVRDGWYSVKLSMSIGYDQERGMFMGSDGDESTLAAGYAQAGFTDVSVERYEVNGYPVLFVEGSRGERRGYVVYVAALVDTNTIVTTYSPAAPMREADRARWAALKAGILASGPSRRIR